MIEIDGEKGGGGLLRTALSLSAITGEPFAIDDVRGSRPDPGLGPQHLAAVEVTAGLCDADVDGAAVGADSLTFRPGALSPGSATVDVGTAGSLTLLFDTLLPVATRLDGRHTVGGVGGTDVKWSPTVAYLRQVKLPLLERFGLSATVDVSRSGFYPAGGGEATLALDPCSLDRIDLPERGGLEDVEIYSKASEHLADAEVAERQADAAESGLEDRGVPRTVEDVAYVDADSPGSAVLLRAVYDDSLVGFDALGERGKPSEEVAGDAVAAFADFHDGRAAVDRHMADQVLVFVALAGGTVRIPELTDHVRTNRDVIRQFGFDVAVDRRGGAVFLEG